MAGNNQNFLLLEPPSIHQMQVHQFQQMQIQLQQMPFQQPSPQQLQQPPSQQLQQPLPQQLQQSPPQQLQQSLSQQFQQPLSQQFQQPQQLQQPSPQQFQQQPPEQSPQLQVQQFQQIIPPQSIPPMQQVHPLQQLQQIQQWHQIQQQQNGEINMEQIYQWINDIVHPSTREVALIELAKRRESVPDLAPLLWHSFGTMTACVQEIVSVYYSLILSTLNEQQSNRVCSALALLQCVASHHETRQLFVDAHITELALPFLNTKTKTLPFEYLRLTTLGVIGVLVKNSEQDIIQSLLMSDVMPYILDIMENHAELSKTVSTFILQKILNTDNGLNYVCSTYDKFIHVVKVLGKVVTFLMGEPSQRLFKHVVRAYSRLSSNQSIRAELAQFVPNQLKDNTFLPFLANDPNTKQFFITFMNNLESSCTPNISGTVAVF